jgi:Htaa
MSSARGPSVVAVGALHWGLKRRFLQYLAGMPDGQCSVSDGAVLAPGPVFVFPADARSPTGATGDSTLLRFRGDLRFKGHHGFLAVRLADPWLEITGSSGTLTVLGLPTGSAARFPLVTFRVQQRDEGAGFEGVDVRLTAEGSEVFNDVYPVGELFDGFSCPPPGGQSGG